MEHQSNNFTRSRDLELPMEVIKKLLTDLKLEDDLQCFCYLQDKKFINKIFYMLQGNVNRTKTSFTIIFLTMDHSRIYQYEDIYRINSQMTKFLARNIRATDFLFKLVIPFEWFVFLPQSSEAEGKAFIQRIFHTVEEHALPCFNYNNISFSASVVEVGQGEVELEEIIKNARTALSQSVHKGDWNIMIVDSYK